MAGGLLQDGGFGFLGVNLRRDRLSLEDGEMAKAINADLHTVLGAAVMRLGSTKQNTTALTESIVRTIARVNDCRYQVANQSLFREFTLLSNMLSGNKVTTIQGFRPLNDSTIWAFIADNAMMSKSDCKVARFFVWGIAAPKSAPALVAGINDGPTGAYLARYTFLRFDGLAIAHESNPSPLAEISLANNDLVFYDLVDPVTDLQVNGIAVYRTVADGQDVLLATTATIPRVEGKYGITQGFEASALEAGLHRLFTRMVDSTVSSISISTGAGNAKLALHARNDTSIGSNAWGGVKKATGEPNNDPSWSFNSATVASNYLVANEFKFAIPATETIAGIVVEFRKTSSEPRALDHAVRIVKGGTISSTDRAKTTTKWPAPWLTFVWESYGSSTDLWGETWTPADINSFGFGVAISAKSSGASATAGIDGVRITIYTSSSTTTLSSIRVTQAWEPDGEGNSEDVAGKRCSQIWEQVDSYSITQTNTWAIADAKADLGLGRIVELDNDPPPLAAWATSHAEHMFLTRDTANPHYLWWSKRFRPEAFPVDNFLEIGTAADPIQAIASFLGFLGVFTRLTKYLITGNATSGFVATQMVSRRGTPAPFSVVGTELGVSFLHRSGIYLTTMIEADKEVSTDILPLFNNETVNDLSPLNWDYAHTVAATAFKRRLYVTYPSGTNIEPDMVMVYSADTGKWYFYRRSLRTLFYDEDIDSLLGGGQDGFVYVLEDGSTDGGTAIAFDVETKDFAGASGPTVRKLFRYLKVDADCDGATLNAVFTVDGEVVATKSLTGNRTKQLLPLPGRMGYSWRVQITYTGRQHPTIYGVSALYVPLETG